MATHGSRSRSSKYSPANRRRHRFPQHPKHVPRLRDHPQLSRVPDQPERAGGRTSPPSPSYRAGRMWCRRSRPAASRGRRRTECPVWQTTTGLPLTGLSARLPRVGVPLSAGRPGGRGPRRRLSWCGWPGRSTGRSPRTPRFRHRRHRGRNTNSWADRAASCIWRSLTPTVPRSWAPTSVRCTTAIRSPRGRPCGSTRTRPAGFTFLDPRATFDPHTICSHAETWVTSLEWDKINESYHANQAGHRQGCLPLLTALAG